MRKWLNLTTSSIALLALIASGCSKQSGSQSKSNEVSTQSSASANARADHRSLGKAPGFVINDLGGNRISFDKYEGKVVLVDFWATWCGPCRRSIPHLAELHSQYSDRGFEVVGISLDRGGTDQVAEFARQFNIPYTVLMGDLQLASQWGVGAGIPAAFLVDRKGEIVDKFIGYQDRAVFQREIEKYL